MAAVAISCRACAYLHRPSGPDNGCAGPRHSFPHLGRFFRHVRSYRGPVALMPTELEVFDYNLDIHDSELESQEDDLRLQVGAFRNLV